MPIVPFIETHNNYPYNYISNNRFNWRSLLTLNLSSVKLLVKEVVLVKNVLLKASTVTGFGIGGCAMIGQSMINVKSEKIETFIHKELYFYFFHTSRIFFN